MDNVNVLVSVFFIIIPVQSVTEPFHIARLQLKEHGNTFRRGKLYSNLTTVKLILGTEGHVYAGGGQHLTQLKFHKSHPTAEVKKIPIECQTGNCPITVMQPGRGAKPLFVCTQEGESAKCSYMDSSGRRRSTTTLYGGGEPALHTGDDLYTTQSGTKNKDGIYRKHLLKDNDNISPPSSRCAGQTYVKIVDRNEDKIYAFYTEENSDQNPDSDIYTPHVSQICKADLGGSKDTLQFQWTSQLSSRLSCGDPGRRLYYTQLLDVAVLKSEDGKDDRVYGLFKNGWEMRAVCVYAMKDIDSIFSKSATKTPSSPTLHAPSSGRPGECVQDSRKLYPELLKYMKNSPEMVDWVEPIGNGSPLLVSRRHYSHIQVDRVGGTGGQEGHHVLLLSMESGAVHKVLGNYSEPFIIAEYHPFTPGTRILSMLLDSTQKKLYVSSSSEVVEIDLRNCSVYGNQCADCVLARDPYCGWDSGRQTCAPHSEGFIQDVPNKTQQKCQSEPHSALQRSDAVDSIPNTYVPESSRHYLVCPVRSHHAKYHWLQEGSERESIMDHEQQQLVLLIDGMRSEDEGLYHCESQEGDYQRTVVQRQLRMSSGAVGLKSFGTLALALLTLLFTLSW